MESQWRGPEQPDLCLEAILLVKWGYQGGCSGDNLRGIMRSRCQHGAGAEAPGCLEQTPV